MQKSNVLSLFAGCKAIEPDEQMLMMCEAEAYGVIDTGLALQQFKYCMHDSALNKQYCVLKRYLQTVYGNSIVEKLEAM